MGGLLLPRSRSHLFASYYRVVIYLRKGWRGDDEEPASAAFVLLPRVQGGAKAGGRMRWSLTSPILLYFLTGRSTTLFYPLAAGCSAYSSTVEGVSTSSAGGGGGEEDK